MLEKKVSYGGGGGGGGGSVQKFRTYMGWVKKCSKTQKFKGTFVHRRGGCTFLLKNNKSISVLLVNILNISEN